ncbi:MAG: hypothetical protein R3F44_01375 [Candidatus Competibacteraceae bacterium]
MGLLLALVGTVVTRSVGDLAAVDGIDDRQRAGILLAAALSSIIAAALPSFSWIPPGSLPVTSSPAQPG